MMIAFRVVIGLAILVCFAPLISVVIASEIAQHYDCILHEGVPNPCIVGGRDIVQTLCLGVMGWLMLTTLRAGTDPAVDRGRDRAMGAQTPPRTDLEAVSTPARP